MNQGFRTSLAAGDRTIVAMGNRRPLGLFVVLSFLLLLTLNPSLAIAQQGATLIGEVTDTGGGLLPGVTITVSSPALQTGTQTIVTDARGQYRLTPLPIGTYTMTFALDGFQMVRREDIRLTVGFVATIDAQLQLGTLAETVLVSASSPVVDVTSTVTSTVLTRETLELVPTSRNSVIGLMQQAPGARPNLDVAGNTMNDVPSFRSFGIPGQSWQTIEGVSTSNGRTNNGSGTFWDYSSIEQAKVETLGHNAEVPLIGVSINAIVKSGGNSFHGQMFTAMTSDKFQSKNIDAKLAAQGITEGGLRYRREVQGELSGRIIRDKLWFYGNTRRRSNSDTLPGVQKPDGTIASIDDTQRYTTWKLSYQASQENKFEAFDTWLYKTQQGRAVTPLVSWDSRITQTTPNHVGRVGWQGTRGNAISSTVQFGYWWNASTFLGHTNEVAATDQLTLLTWGLDSSGNEHTLSRRLSTKADVDWYQPGFFHGDHAFRFGGEYTTALGDRYRDDRGAAQNYTRTFRGGVATQVGIWNTPTRPKTPTVHTAGFLSDSWRVGRGLTLNLGVRYAIDQGIIPEQCREATASPFTELFPAECFQEIKFATWQSVSPRLNAAYDIGNKGTTVIKGGWGRYSSMRSADSMTNANRNATQLATYRWNDLDGDQLWDVGESNLSPNGGDFLSQTFQGTSAALANAVANPDEKQPYQDQYVLGVERVLIPRLSVRVTGVYVRALRTSVLTNLLRPYEAYNIPITNLDPGPDGALGTSDDTGQAITYYDYPVQYRGLAFQRPTLINSPEARTYKSIEVAASKQYAAGWQFLASYSATKQGVPIITTTGDAFTDDPNAKIFTADHTWEWLGRMSGSRTLPLGLLVSANYEHRSGNPFARTFSFRGGAQIPTITLRVEPIGAHRTPNINLLDVRLAKVIRFSSSSRVELRVNVYNLINANTPTSVVQGSGAKFLDATSILSPRVAEFGATYFF